MKSEYTGRVVITYGTFDLFHVGHLNLLERLRESGDYLIVGVSTDEFNAGKGKKTVIPFADRLRIVQALGCVDQAIPETSWEQKRTDIEKYKVSIFGMGSDWAGQFDELKDCCEVVYLDRTDGVSSSSFKTRLRQLDTAHVDDLKKALDLVSAVVERFDW